MPQILYAAPIVTKTIEKLKTRCQQLKNQGVSPTMCVVLVGDNPASLSYIKNKKKMCEQVGAQFILKHFSSDISRDDFLQEVQQLNMNASIHGIIIQLPVSAHLKDLNLSHLIIPSKDIDGFHIENTRHLYQGSSDPSLLLPCTPKGIVQLLTHYQIEVTGKNIVIIGRSLIVGKPLSLLLTNLNATVTLAHSKTKHLEHFTRNADIIVVAIGKAKMFNKFYLSDNKKPVIIDVGMNSLDDKLCGDVDFDDVCERVKAMTPVPGGVGPMTVLSLIENLISATEKQTRN